MKNELLVPIIMICCVVLLIVLVAAKYEWFKDNDKK